MKAVNDFPWIPFYMGLAQAIAKYSEREAELFQMLEKLASQTPLMHYLHFDRPEFWKARGSRPDPFTMMAIFNRATTDAHRTELAGKLGSLFGLEETPPTVFHGIAHLDPRNSIYNDPDSIWKLFKQCLSGSSDQHFQQAWDNAIKGGNGLAMLSIALFWCNPLAYLPVDGISAPFLERKIGLEPLPTHASGKEYVEYMRQTAEKLPHIPWPAIALNAWRSVQPAGDN